MAAFSELVSMLMSSWTLPGLTAMATLEAGTLVVDATRAAMDEITAVV